MTAYADASAVVKRYLVNEPGSEVVLEQEALIVSTLTAVEVSSAIWRRQRMGEIEPAQAARLAAAARSDLTGGDVGIIAIPPTTWVIEDASRFTGTVGLRAYDAVQLATAVAARDAYPDCTEFICFDVKLGAAAAAHGFELVGAAED